MEERGYGTKGHIRAGTGTDDLSLSSPDTGGEISMEVILVPPRRGGKNRPNNLFLEGAY